MKIPDLMSKVEQVSQKYADIYHVERDDDWFVLKVQEELGELIQSYLMMKRKGRNKGKTTSEIRENFAREVADVTCHILLLAHRFKIDLEKEIEDKWLKWES